VRALRVIALVLLTIVLSGFEAILVCLSGGLFTVIKNVVAIPEVVRPGIVSPTVSSRQDQEQ
jgi:hypothetical protein